MITPPKIPLWLLRRFAGSDISEELEGDLLEEFEENLEQYGTGYARRIYTMTVLRSLRPYLLTHKREHRKPKSSDMLKYHFKVAWRNFFKSRLYSVINVFGLSLGLASTILISIFLVDQAQIDNQLTNRNRIYRLETITQDQGAGQVNTRINPSVAPALFNEIPEIEHFVRLQSSGITFKSEMNGAPDLIEEDVLLVDMAFFEVFDFELVYGNPTSALSHFNNIVLSERAALKYFNSTDVVGKVLETTNAKRSQFEVSAVMKNMPTNSSIQFDFIIPKSVDTNPPVNFRALVLSIPAYFLLKEQTSPDQVLKKVKGALEKYTDRDSIVNLEFQLTSLEEVIYNIDATDGIVATLDKRLTQIFLLIAVFIIALAFINYLNLATSRAIDRAREIGVRKVIGANGVNLWGQFLSESLLCTALSIPVIVLLVELFIPYFEGVIGQSLTFRYYHSPEFVLASLGLIAFIGLLAGVYPAKLISGFRFTDVVQGRFNNTTKGQILRKTLVVFQFTFSIGLIVSVLLIQQQLDFVRAKSFSFNPEEIISIEGSRNIGNNFSAIKDELLKVPGVKQVSASNGAPGVRGAVSIRFKAGFDFSVKGVTVDEDFVSMFGLEVLEGQNFGDRNEGTENHVLINQSMARALNGQNPLETRFRLIGEDTSRVVGVVEDFHIASLHNAVEPTVFMLPGNIFGVRRMLVKLETEDMTGTLEGLQQAWNKFFPDTLLQFDFLDEKIEKLYTAEMKLGRVFNLFTGLAIFISCLGLFSYASYYIKIRIKEIGIRKVFGASTRHIVSMLSRQVILMVVLAAIIASPLSYYFLDKWLQNFVYKVPVSLEVFGLAFIASVLIAWFTVGYQAFRAALSNPVNSLRRE